MNGEKGTLKQNRHVKASWRGTLFEKELRQNAATIIALCGLLAAFLLLRWLVGDFLHVPRRIAFGRLVYWATFAVIAVLGSVFLAEENGSASVNFLLRLPLERKQIFLTKLLSHLAFIVALLVIGPLVALLLGLLLVLFGFLVAPLFQEYSIAVGVLNWNPPQWEIRASYTAAVWLPLMYFLAVGCSILLDRAIAAFLAAAASAAIAYAGCEYVGLQVSQWVTRSDLPQLELAHVISNILLTCLVAVAAVLSWWLFSRKEAR